MFHQSIPAGAGQIKWLTGLGVAQKHRWVDTAGGRRGAVSEDTWATETSQLSHSLSHPTSSEGSNMVIYYTLKTTDVMAVDHINDVLSKILAFVTSTISVTVVYTLIQAFFPYIREKSAKRRFVWTPEEAP